VTTSHQAIYRRWRAQTFGQIVGQGPVVETLRNAVRSGRVAHALLFVGPRGTGKTSMARIVAKALNCLDLRDGEPCDACVACVAIREGRALDVIELDAASNNRVDDIRELIPRIYTAPSDLRRKVFIVDEVQRIKEGWDLLLKTLEEPPEHVAFIFCTTDSSGIRPAVLSRVQRFDFRRLSTTEIEGKLRAILAADDRVAADDAIRLIARLAAGGMRDAESILDQVLSSSDGTVDADRVRDLLGLAEEDIVERFAAALVSGDARSGLAILADLDDRGRDLRSFLDQVVESLRSAIGERVAGGRPADDLPDYARAAARLIAIDPARSGPGGLRLQLEVALLTPAGPTSGTDRTMPAAPPSVAPDTSPAPPETEAPPSSAPAPRAATRSTRRTSAADTTEAPAAATRPSRGRPVPASETAPPAAEPGRAASEAGLSSAEATPSPVAGGDPGLETLRARWPEVVAYLSQHPPTKPLIEACQPISVEGAVVTLGFPESKAFLRDLIERRRGHLEEGISRFLDREVAVRCVATNVEIAPDLPVGVGTDDDGERLLAEARRIFADDLVDVGEIR